MKNVVTVCLVLGSMFYLTGCAGNAPSVSDKDIKIENLRDALYAGGMIWQDQPVNASRKLSQKDAEAYCKNLRLLDMEGWRLPTIPETEADTRMYERFKHSKRNRYYHSSSRHCEAVEYVNDITAVPLLAVAGALGAMVGKPVDMSMECQYGYTSSRFITEQRRGSALFRCVLDKKEYIRQRKTQLQKIAQYRNEGTYEGYIKAFRLSNDMSDLKKANALASTEEEKLKVEQQVVRSIDPQKLVDVTILDQNGESINASRGDMFKLISYASSHKNVSLATKVHSDILETGRYRVKVQYILDVPYQVEGTYLLTFRSKEHEKIPVTQTYVLDRTNGYTSRKTVTFKNVVTSLHASMMNVKKKIDGKVTVSSKVLSVEAVR